MTPNRTRKRDSVVSDPTQQTALSVADAERITKGITKLQISRAARRLERRDEWREAAVEVTDVARFASRPESIPANRVAARDDTIAPVPVAWLEASATVACDAVSHARYARASLARAAVLVPAVYGDGLDLHPTCRIESHAGATAGDAPAVITYASANAGRIPIRSAHRMWASADTAHRRARSAP